MKKIKKIFYQDYIIYGQSQYLSLAKSFLNKNYNIIEIYKDTKRNYVSKIEMDHKYYVVKSPRSEQKLFQKKILSILKKPEVLSTLQNVNAAIDIYGFTELVRPYVAILKKRLFLEESYLIMEAIDGNPFHIAGDLKHLMSWVFQFHQAGFYHKDLNTSNVLIENLSMRVFDTQAKMEKVSHFHRNYDLLTLKQDQIVLNENFQVEDYYPIQKSLSWYLACLLKWFKYNRLSLCFRERRHKKRER